MTVLHWGSLRDHKTEEPMRLCTTRTYTSMGMSVWYLIERVPRVLFVLSIISAGPVPSTIVFRGRISVKVHNVSYLIFVYLTSRSRLSAQCTLRTGLRCACRHSLHAHLSNALRMAHRAGCYVVHRCNNIGQHVRHSFVDNVVWCRAIDGLQFMSTVRRDLLKLNAQPF